MCKTRVRHIREIPIHFAERTHGQSKLTFAEQFRCLEHLSRLYDFTYPRASPVMKFLIVLAASWLFAFTLFMALREFRVYTVFAVPLSYVLSYRHHRDLPCAATSVPSENSSFDPNLGAIFF